jgi:hypothetical protein
MSFMQRGDLNGLVALFAADAELADGVDSGVAGTVGGIRQGPEVPSV